MEVVRSYITGKTAREAAAREAASMTFMWTPGEAAAEATPDAPKEAAAGGKDAGGKEDLRRRTRGLVPQGLIVPRAVRCTCNRV